MAGFAAAQHAAAQFDGEVDGRGAVPAGGYQPAPPLGAPPWAGGSPDGASEGVLSTEEHKQRQASALFAMPGVTPPTELQAEWDGREKDKSKKLMSELALAAKYGEPSPQFYPGEDQLRKIAAAAKQGYFVPDILSKPVHSSDRILASYIRSMLPVAHGGIWQFRQSPAAVLNEMGHMMDLALNSKVARSEAERQAVRWSLAIRERLFKISQARPLQSGDMNTHNLWQEAFMFMESGAPAAAPGPARPREAQDYSQRDPLQRDHKDYCLWHLIYKCTQTKCGRVHDCPICKECGPTRVAPLVYHLGQLKKPQKIVQCSSSHAERPRSRSSRRERGSDRGRGADRGRGNDKEGRW